MEGEQRTEGQNGCDLVFIHHIHVRSFIRGKRVKSSAVGSKLSLVIGIRIQYSFLLLMKKFTTTSIKGCLERYSSIQSRQRNLFGHSKLARSFEFFF